MCVDDIVCQGAEPLFFLDYIAVGKLDPDHIEQLVEGVAEGCRQAGCALIGGEMAEHPGAMDPGEFDLVGFAVGVAERDRLITGEHVRAGDVADRPAVTRACAPTATRSPASAARERRPRPRRPGLSRAPTTPSPTSCSCRRSIYAPGDRGAAPPGRRARRRPHHRRRPAGNLVARAPRSTSTPWSTRRSWEPPRIFGEIQRLGEVRDDEMRKVFNLGIGMVVVVAADEAHRALDLLRTDGHRAVEIGQVTKATARSGGSDLRPHRFRGPKSRSKSCRCVTNRSGGESEA